MSCLCLRNLIWSVATVHPINLSFRLGSRAVVNFSRVTVPILPPSFSPSTRTDIKMTPLRDPRGDAAWKPQPFNMTDRHIKSVCPAMMPFEHNDPISPQELGSYFISWKRVNPRAARQINWSFGRWNGASWKIGRPGG